MRKGVLSHDGLVGLHRHVHQAGHGTAQRVDLPVVYVSVNPQVLVAFQDHHHLFKGSVTGPLAYSVYGNLNLTRSSHYSGHSVGRRHSQVVMAMGGYDCVLDAVYVFEKVLDLLRILVRKAVASGVGYVHHGGAGLYDGLYHACQVLVLCAAGILGVELHVLHIFLGVLDGLDRALENLLAVGVELVLYVVVRGAYSGVDPLVLGILQSLGRSVNVFLDRAAQGAYRRPGHGLGDFNYRVEIAGAGYGETCLYYIDSKLLQRLCNLDFLDGVELTPRDLLAVPECGVEYVDFIVHKE